VLVAHTRVPNGPGMPSSRRSTPVRFGRSHSRRKTRVEAASSEHLLQSTTGHDTSTPLPSSLERIQGSAINPPAPLFALNVSEASIQDSLR